MADENFLKALKAYERYCNRNGFIYQEPNEKLSEIEGDFIVLNNINGELVRYEISTGKIHVNIEYADK